jgi:hypothetical protein
VIVLVWILALVVQAAPVDIQLRLYIGPKVVVSPEGFSDPVAKPITDSVHDLRKAFRKYRGLTLVQKPEDAALQLLVTGRTVHSVNAGAMAVPIGASVVAAPLKDEFGVVGTELQVRDYAKIFVAAKRTWTGAADQIAKDVAAWINANLPKVRELIAAK